MADMFSRLKLHLLPLLAMVLMSSAASVAASKAAPVISVQPQSQQVDLLSTVALRVVATGEPLQYQWQLNGFNIAKATNDTLILNGIQILSLGNYRVKVSNAGGDTFSTVAKISLKLIPTALTDMFENRALTTALADSKTAINIGATLQSGEPLHDGNPGGHSMWVAWRAPATGIATFTTIGSQFDTVLAVYTGTSISNLQQVAADDDSGGLLTSQVKFNAIAGTEYQIAVDGFNGLTGICSLNWNLQITDNLLPTILAITGNKTVGLGEPVTLSVSVNTPVATFRWYFNGQPIQGAQSSVLQIASTQPENVGNYQVKVTALGLSVLSLPMSVQINDTDGTVNRNSAAYDKFGAMIGAWPNVLPPITPALLSAKSMHRSAATDSRGYTTTQTFNTTGSTKDPGEPDACGVHGGASMWYAYKAPANGTLEIDTQGSSFDTVLAVYIGPGTDYATLTNVDCNNDADASSKWSKVIFTAKSGTTYYLQLDGVNGAHGTAYLNITLGNAPGVTSQPQSQAGVAGGTVTLQIAATGAPAPKFQWYFNSTALGVATNSSLVITNFQQSLSGKYYATVANRIGTVTSQQADLAVAAPAGCASLCFDSSGFATVHILGTTTQSAILQTSTNLIVWKSIATNILSSGAWDYTDTNSRAISAQFYRVIPGP